MSAENFVSNGNATQLFTKVGQKFNKKLDKIDEMPEPSENLEGTVVIYVGPSNSNYTKGSIYECQEVTPATSPKTYTWAQISDGGSITVDSELDATSPNPVQNSVLTPEILSRLKVYNNTSDIPTASIDHVGEIFLYTGIAGPGIKPFSFYRCELDGANYTWKLISGYVINGYYNKTDGKFYYNLNSSTGVYAYEIRALEGIIYIDMDKLVPYVYDSTNTQYRVIGGTNIFDGTIAEYEALSQSEQMQYSHIADEDSASETVTDAVTDGDMRPVTSNAVYEELNIATLWTNTSPNSNFAAQTVPLNLLSYKHIIIKYKLSISSTVYGTIFVPIDGLSYLMGLATTQFRYRLITPTNTGVQFDEGKAATTYGTATPTVSNENIIPITIYGCKF